MKFDQVAHDESEHTTQSNNKNTDNDNDAERI